MPNAPKSAGEAVSASTSSTGTNSVASLIVKHGLALSAFQAAIQAHPSDNEPDRTIVQKAGKAERAALDALIAVPVMTAAEAGTKAAYLLDNIEGEIADYFGEEPLIRALLNSFRRLSSDDAVQQEEPAARALRSLIFDGEGDMRKVYDLALILHDRMHDTSPISGELQAALTWITSDLVGLGRELGKHQDALFAALGVGAVE